MSTVTIESSRSLILPTRQPMLSPVSWRILIAMVIVVLGLVPICSMLVPEGSPFHLSAYALTLVGKIMCYAIGALALDLVWGYDFPGYTRTVDVHVQQVREKLAAASITDPSIQTVWGVGYRLELSAS